MTYRVHVLGGWERTVKADSEMEAKRAALSSLRLSGHSLRALNRDHTEPYRLEDDKALGLKAEVHAIKLEKE